MARIRYRKIKIHIDCGTGITGVVRSCTRVNPHYRNDGDSARSGTRIRE